MLGPFNTLRVSLLLVFFSLCFFLPSVPTAHAGVATGLVGYWTFDGKNTNWTSATITTML